MCEKPTLQEAGGFYKSRGTTPVSCNLGTNEEKGGQEIPEALEALFLFWEGS